MITREEVEHVLKALKCKKSNGTYSINLELPKSGHDRLAEILLQIGK